MRALGIAERSLALGYLEVALHHDAAELLAARALRIPAELGARLGGVTPEVHDVGRPVELGVDADEHPARLPVVTLLVDALALPAEADANVLEGPLHELPHGMLDTRSDDEVIRLVLLQDQPHALDVVLGVAPVAQAVEVAELQVVLQALGNARCGERDLAGHEVLAAPRRLVVEQDAVAREHAVGLAVLLGDPVAVLLRHGVGRVRVEVGLLVLGHLLDLAVELGGRSLVDAAGLLEPQDADGLQHAQHAERVHVAGVLGRAEGGADVGLGGEVVHLVRSDLRHDADHRRGVGEIAVVQRHRALREQVVDAAGGVLRGAADDAVDLVALL